MHKLTKNKDILGITIIFLGAPVLWILAKIFSINQTILVYSLMTLGIFLIFNFKNTLVKGFIRNAGRIVFLPLFCLIIFLIQDFHKYGLSVSVLYSTFPVLLFITFLTIKREIIEKIPSWFAIFGGISCVLILTQNLSTAINESTRLYAGDAVSPNTVAFVGGLTAIFCLYEILEKTQLSKIYFYLLLVCLISAISVCIYTNTRSVYIGLLIVLIFNYKRIFIKKNIKYKRILIAFTFLFCIYLFFSNSLISRYFIDSVVAYFKNGFNSYVNGEGGELSALTRRNLVNVAINNINNFDVKGFLFGYGYKSLYVDFPILQSFNDLGFFMGIYFLFVTLLFPMWIIIMSSNKKDNVQGIITNIYLFFLINLFFHGQPYDFSIWDPIVLFYLFINNKKRIRSI